MVIVTKNLKTTNVSYWHQKDIEECEKGGANVIYKGIQCFWVGEHKTDCLIQGYRDEDSKSSIIKTLENIEKLEFKGMVQPSLSINLYQLDFDKMVRVFSEYKKDKESKWATLAGRGNFLQNKNIHNCASIILFLLFEGGIGDSTIGYGRMLSQAGFLLGVLLSLGQFYSISLTQYILMPFVVAIAGAAVGGAIDGYRDSQSFIDIVNKSNKNSIVNASIMLVSVIISSIGSIFLVQRAINSFVTSPQNVIDICRWASKAEQSRSFPETIKSTFFGSSRQDNEEGPPHKLINQS